MILRKVGKIPSDFVDKMYLRSCRTGNATSDDGGFGTLGGAAIRGIVGNDMGKRV